MLIRRYMRKARLVARDSSVEAMVHDQVREHTDPKDRGKQTGWCGHKSLALRAARKQKTVCQ